MDSIPYVAVALVSFLLIVALVFFLKKDKERKKLSMLASLAFAFVVAGIVFGDDRLLGYSLIGFGVFLAVLDIFLKR